MAISSLLLALQNAADGPIGTYLTGIGVAVPNAVSAANSPSSAWAPGASGVSFSSADSVGSNGYVGPGHGAQTYDIEALYVQQVGSNLVITGISGANLAAMPSGASGSCPSGSLCNTFPVGDFFIGTGTSSNFTSVEAIEVTGQHYDMDSSGYTIGWTSPLAAGSVVDVNGADPVNGHAAFQAIVNTSYPGSAINSNYVVHCGELCGNDFIRTSVDVPEPGSLWLLAAGLLCAVTLGAGRQRRLAPGGGQARDVSRTW